MTFEAPVEDILFSLRHVARAGETDGWDDELAADVIGHFGSFAAGVLAPLNAVGDRQGARLVDGAVVMPDGFAAAYDALAEAGWQGITAPTEHLGMGLSPLVGAATSEIFSGANHAMQMVCGLVPGAIETLLHFGTDAQKTKWMPSLTTGKALTTMCLTEAGAGSDLSRIRCKAEPAGAAWEITGEKIFISGGDQDMADVLHFVLARTSPDGLKGLSLFLCPKGPGVTVTRLEEKLGLHASPTCQMAFDRAKAELIGAEGEGLRAMFTVMNHARLDVSLQGVAHAARAAQIARSYAAERKQGRRADGSEAVLTDHADVQRMLSEQDALALGARAMCHVAMAELVRGTRPALLEFLTPLCKVFCSEAGIRSADLGIQILGGYGYLEEYGLSQCWRDARITAIYEGANGIHARTTATRGLRGPGADLFSDLIRELAGSALTSELTAWEAARDALRRDPDPTPKAHAFCQDTCRLFYKACWQRIAAMADKHSDPDRIIARAKTV